MDPSPKEHPKVLTYQGNHLIRLFYCSKVCEMQSAVRTDPSETHAMPIKTELSSFYSLTNLSTNKHASQDIVCMILTVLYSVSCIVFCCMPAL